MISAVRRFRIQTAAPSAFFLRRPHSTISGRMGQPPIQPSRMSQSGQLRRKCSRNASNSALLHASFMECVLRSTAQRSSWLSKLQGIIFISGEIYADHLAPSQVSRQEGSIPAPSRKRAGTLQESKPIFQSKRFSPVSRISSRKGPKSSGMTYSAVPRPTGL